MTTPQKHILQKIIKNIYFVFYHNLNEVCSLDFGLKISGEPVLGVLKTPIGRFLLALKGRLPDLTFKLSSVKESNPKRFPLSLIGELAKEIKPKRLQTIKNKIGKRLERIIFLISKELIDTVLP